MLNKDIGFVAVDQPAEVKLETFPYTKYGVIEGTVIDVSSDAVQDEQLGFVGIDTLTITVAKKRSR